jgi:predicted secreted Zn-dependent protease
MSAKRKKTAQSISVHRPLPRETAVIDPETLADHRSAADLPSHATSRPSRQSAVLQLQRQQGNAYVQRLLGQSTAAGLVQRQKKKASGKSKGQGPGQIKNAKEEFYDVSGTALDDITTQLGPFDGHASETYTALTIKGEVKPTKTKEDTYRVKVQWKIVDGVVRMPRWTDYGAACPAAKAEWDRFMRLVRQHEQEAHVDVSDKFVKELDETDTVITGDTMDELQANLEAKQQELRDRLQAIHDACDHGVGLDAILHPDNGRCDEE